MTHLRERFVDHGAEHKHSYRQLAVSPLESIAYSAEKTERQQTGAESSPGTELERGLHWETEYVLVQTVYFNSNYILGCLRRVACSGVPASCSSIRENPVFVF